MSDPPSLLTLTFGQSTRLDSFIPNSRRKLFQKAPKFPTQLTLIHSIDPSNDRALHQHLLLQTALNASSLQSKNVVIFTKQPWTKLPIENNLNPDVLSCINFIYPANTDELFLYMSALGGLTNVFEVPDVILFDNVDHLISTTTRRCHDDDDQLSASDILVKFFASLDHLVRCIGDRKPVSSLAISSTPPFPVEQLLRWFHEIWQLRVEGDQQALIRCGVDEDLQVQFVTGDNEELCISCKTLNFVKQPSHLHLK